MFREKNIADWKLVWGFMTTCPQPVFSRKAIFFSRSDFSAGSIPPLSLIWLLGWVVLYILEKQVNLGYDCFVYIYVFQGAGLIPRPLSFWQGERDKLEIKYGIG